ncbi:MAG: hypothetical protein ACFNWT_05210 [Prevotella denticola]
MSKDLLLYKERHSVLEKARMEIHTEPYLTGWYDVIWLEGMELYCIQTDSAEEEKEEKRGKMDFFEVLSDTNH